jgi:hypothetical protein
MAFSEYEESVLRQYVRDHTPMTTVNPQRVTGPSQRVSDMASVKHELATLPRMETVNLNVDPLVESKLRSAGIFRKPGEVYSLGVSRFDILNLEPNMLALRIAEQTEQALASGNAEPKPNWSDPFTKPPVLRAVFTD